MHDDLKALVRFRAVVLHYTDIECVPSRTNAGEGGLVGVGGAPEGLRSVPERVLVLGGKDAGIVRGRESYLESGDVPVSDLDAVGGII